MENGENLNQFMSLKNLNFSIEKIIIKERPKKLKEKWTVEIIPTKAIISDDVLELLEKGLIDFPDML